MTIDLIPALCEKMASIHWDGICDRYAKLGKLIQTDVWPLPILSLLPHSFVLYFLCFYFHKYQVKTN